MDIEQQNIQIMIKMIIDKLYNNTLKEYYEELSMKKDDKIKEQDKEIKGALERHLETINLNEQEIEKLRKEMGQQNEGEKKKKEEEIEILKHRNTIAQQQMTGMKAILRAKTDDETAKELLNLETKINQAFPGLLN
jgi:hypothetical protein